MIRQTITAFRTLSILPLPGKNAKNMVSSIPFFSLVGFFMGVLFIAVFIPLRLFIPDLSFISSIIVVLLCSVFTGGLHLDGIADIFDAFLGGRTKEEILKILKDPRLGTFGVLAVVFDLLLKISFTEYIFKNPELILIIPIGFIFSRIAQGYILISVPYVRDSNGTGFHYSAYLINNKVRIIILTTVGLLIWYIACGFVSGFLFILCGLVTGILSVLIFILVCKKKIGGITGDCIGTVNELFEIMFVFTGIVLHYLNIF